MWKSMKKMKSQKSEYQFAKGCGSAVRSFLALELLFQAALIILGNQFQEWNVSASYQMGMQLVLILIFALFEVVAPASGRYRMLVNTTLELIILAVFGLFGFLQRARLQLGYQAIYNDFIGYWNKYNGSNYGTYSCDGTGKEMALCFTILLVVVFSLTIRYVAGIRLILLLPCFLTLSLGLLVNTLPNWTGLGFFFVGTVILYSGSWESTKVTFQARQGKKDHKQAAIAAQMGSLFLVAVIGIAVISLTPLAFGKATGMIPDRAENFMKFQQSMEEKVKDLGNISFGNGKTFVDNQTPEYTDKEILTIHASQIPSSNLYLKDFSSGTYVRGEWKRGDSFSREAKKAGYEPEHLAVLLHQQFFEWEQASAGPGSPSEIMDYSIDYRQSWMGSALVPYFSDLSECGDSVWLSDEGVAKKSRDVQSIQFQGLQTNDLITLGVVEESSQLTEQESEAMDWYDQFAVEHYCNGSADVPMIKDYAQSVAESFMDQGWDVSVYPENEEKIKAAQYYENQMVQQFLKDPYYLSEEHSEDDEKILQRVAENFVRFDMAEMVKQQLSSEAAYNLYLNQIPEGTDTIQYFLETGQEGYCMHFASAGALILQELGVPARYASGYVVKGYGFEKDGELYSEDVIDRNGHAWVEIYFNGYGWVPFEMTPGYQTTENSLPTDERYEKQLKKQHSDKNAKKEETESTESSETQNVSESSETVTQTESQNSENTQRKNNTQSAGTTGGSSSQTGAAGTNKAIRIIVMILLIFVATAFVLSQAVRASRKYKGVLIAELHARQNRRAVRRMNRRIYHRLWNHAPEVLHVPKKKRGSSKVQLSYLTDEEFLQKLICTYPAVSSEDWKHYMEIVQKAVFSQEEITQEEVRFCYRVYQHYRDRR